MLIDGRTLPSDHLLQTDLCIIGAGAAGITLALAFAGHPDVKVCLAESGAFEFETAIQELCRGKTIGAPPYEPYHTRLRYFGGSTNHWGGWCRRLEEMDFEGRPWVPHSGWPIRRSELAPYYDEASALCEVSDLGLEAATWSEHLGLPALTLADSRLRNMMFVVSPPTRFGEVYRERLLAAANLTICRTATSSASAEARRDRPSIRSRSRPSPAIVSRSRRAASCSPAAASRTLASCCALSVWRMAWPTPTTWLGATSWSTPTSTSGGWRSAISGIPAFTSTATR